MHFLWPFSGSTVPDEMNTSFGPRIDADRWDFHDGIDLPASVGTPVRAIASGTVYRAGPADKTADGRGFGSSHIILEVVDPIDGENDLYIVYLHLDSIAEAVIPGTPVNQGDVIGSVGQEDATYPHLHFEFRKGGPEARRSVHPLRYLPYPNTSNVTQLRLDRCNFYDDDRKRAVRLAFAMPDRREGDLQRVQVELRGGGLAPRTFRVDLNDRETIASGRGEAQAFTNGIALEGYQRSNLKGDGRADLRYGVIVEGVSPEYDSVELRVIDVASGNPATAVFALPALAPGERPVHKSAGFDAPAFPPSGWHATVRPGCVCDADDAAALAGARGLLCRDVQSPQGTPIRSALRAALPPGRMGWRLEADVRAAELGMGKGLGIHPLALLAGDRIVAAACLRRIGLDQYAAGVLIRSLDGFVRERIDVIEGTVGRQEWVRWELDLLRLGTRSTTVVLRVDRNVVARVGGDTSGIEPDTACAGILHRHGGLRVTLHLDRLLLTEAPR